MVNDGEKVLIQQRGVLKRKLTLLEKFLKDFEATIPTDVQREEISQWYSTSQSLLTKFEEIQDQIECLGDEEQVDSEREDFLNRYMKAMGLSKHLMQADEKFENCSTSSKLEVGAGVGFTSSRIKLPTISLPSFDGSLDSWLSFRDTYLSLIHTQNLSAIQKFHYLRAALTGHAAQVIKSLDFTAENYDLAWELLEGRYQNKRLLVHSHLKALFTMQAISKESPGQLRKLIDTARKNLRSLDNLGEPTSTWDTMIIYILTSKLDVNTEREWEKERGELQGSSENVKLEQLLRFLRDRADLLDVLKASSSSAKTTNDNTHVQGHKSVNKPSEGPYSANKNRTETHSYIANNNSANNTNNFNSQNKSKTHNEKKFSCVMCSAKHPLYTCNAFLELPVTEKIELLNKNNLCLNCLRYGHQADTCWFGPCKRCSVKHNSLLHTDSEQNTPTPPIVGSQSASLHTQFDEIVEVGNSNSPYVLLSTALVEIRDNNDKMHTVRAILDNGSQTSFISASLAKKLDVKCLQSTLKIAGVGHTVTQATQACDIDIKSKVNNFTRRIPCYVLPQITSSLLSLKLQPNSIHIPEHIVLADPEFYSPHNVEMLIGAEVFWELLSEGKIRLPCGPYLQNTKLGWVISGSLNTRNTTNKQRVAEAACNFTQTLDTQLQKFWELEEVHKTNKFTEEEQACEDLFVNSTLRDETGRFSVRIPLKEPADVLGDTRTLAENRFFGLERKLERSDKFKTLYCDFMTEYESLGHMTRVEDYSKQAHYFLPHHGVLREHSTTTKLRVVFDASFASRSGKSLNDIQHIGPPLQNDIFAILLRFRQHQFVACADIEKFYRQILIEKDQRDLQLILWRKNHTEPLSVYRLNTITYGTASAPFLSLRCLRQLALECEDPVVARVIKEDFFVDDLVTSHENKEELHAICDKVSEVLNSACFPLRKWVFNTHTNGDTDSSKELDLGDQCQSRTLGLGWLYNTDEIHFTSEIEEISPPITKRKILSAVAQIYDPLGLLGPAIILAKILLQRLWLAKVDWDDQVPTEVVRAWTSFVSALSALKSLRVPRHIKNPHAEVLELHIFTDASQSAYGACAYVRSFTIADTHALTRLLCAKSKVAPVKTVSVPRLELCGAVLGARLYQKIKDALHLTFHKVFFWTDSTIVIGWLRTSPSSLKTFVQNRVVEINELTGSALWMHVKGKENPADLISRGVYLDALKDSTLWWSGPPFLLSSNASWSQNHSQIDTDFDLPELRSSVHCVAVETSVNPLSFDRFSYFNRLKRTAAYIRRFIFNSKTKNKLARRSGPLTAEELGGATTMLVRLAQSESFAKEYNALKSKDTLKSSRNISGLNVFLDDENIIRVGGRLGNSDFPYEKKHPVLLCSKHKFTQLLFDHEHKRLLHCGPQLLLATIRESWWPLCGRNLSKKVVHGCVRCARMKAKTPSPIMGNLPSERLQPGYAFMRCGVDYAGPLSMLNRRGRGAKLEKCYICIFVCFSTKAVHLELVTSLTSHDYLLALKRFISRRGKPIEIFSDNGRNFVGAAKEVSSFLQINTHELTNALANDGIKFTFIPPYASHFGGLWESAVKSCKHHLRRVMGNARFTYEEFNTVLVQIEGVLNSRPLTPMSADPNDMQPLTPAHFLIGRPITAPPSADITTTPWNRLPRYDRIEQVRQHFWQRWHKEYLAELQTRNKWQLHKEDLSVNEMVLLKDDNLPPLKWRLGRIIHTYPGADGISRVADVKTEAGVVRRAFSKICPLRLPDQERP